MNFGVQPMHERLRKRQGLIDIGGHHVYLPWLDHSSFVVDAGANRGAFASSLSECVSCRIVALEPNQALRPAEQLPAAVTWLAVGLGRVPALERFRVSKNPEASSFRPELVPDDELLEERTVEVISLGEIFDRFKIQQVDLLKLDIEGSEVDLLLGESEENLRAVRQISVEFHSFLSDASESRRVAAVARRLEALGFVALSGSAPALHETDALYINARARTLPASVMFHLNAVEPTMIGLRAAGGAVRRVLRRTSQKRENHGRA